MAKVTWAGAREIAADLAGWPRGRTTGTHTYLAARYLHILTSGRSSSVALAAARGIPRSPHRATMPLPHLDAQYTRALANLKQDGITFLPHLLDADKIAQIVDFARTAPAVLADSRRATVRGTYQDRSAATRSARIIEPFVLDNQLIQSVISNTALIAIAENYFRTRILVHPPQLYWSCAPIAFDAAAPQAQTPEPLQTAEEFHWDFDGLGGLRLHMYLTDVDTGSAPMKYVKGSHKPGTLRAWRLRNADRGVQDADVWARFTADDVLTVTGPAGTTFLSNSNGLHRGTPATTRDRLFLVMPFQATSFAGYQLKPRLVTPKDPVFAEMLANRAPSLNWFRNRDNS